jgi:hypothetical protein
MRSLTSTRARRGAVTTLAGTLAAVLAASAVARFPSPADAQVSARPPAPGGEQGPNDDMDLMQGTWERQIRPEEKLPYVRCVKETGRGTEVVTYFAADGSVQRRHTVDFLLEQHGPVRVFTFWNHVVTDGPDKGTRNPDKRSYIYRLNGDELAEVWGFLPGQEQRPVSYHVHRRVPAAGAKAGPPAGGGRDAGAPAGPGAPAPAGTRRP